MMSIERISVAVVVLTVTIIVSNTVRCSTPTSDAATVLPKAPFSTTLPATLNDELLDVLENFHSPLPGKADVMKNVHSSPLPGIGLPAMETAHSSLPLVTDRIPIMHLTSAPALKSVDGDQSSHPGSADPVTTINPTVVQGLQLQHLQRPVGRDQQSSDRGNNEMIEPQLQSGGHPAGKPFPVSIPPPQIAGTDPSPAAHPQSSSPIGIPHPSSHPTDPTPLKIEPIRLSPNFNHELSKLLTDLRMNSSALHETIAEALDKNKNLATGPATRPAEILPIVISPGASPAASGAPGAPAPMQPPKVRRPILGPNQTPLDYLLSSSSPMLYHSTSVLGRFTPNTISTNSTPAAVHQPAPSTSAKPRPNLEFVKYLLTLPRYQQALNDLIDSQFSTQT